MRGKAMRVTERGELPLRSLWPACLPVAMAEVPETFPYVHLSCHEYDVRKLTRDCSTAGEELNLPLLLSLGIVIGLE